MARPFTNAGVREVDWCDCVLVLVELPSQQVSLTF